MPTGPIQHPAPALEHRLPDVDGRAVDPNSTGER